MERPSLRHAALGDCECVRAGRIGQPINTLSSSAYLLAAIPIARNAPRVAWATVFIGLGSMAYHGPGTRRDRWLHDLSIAGLIGATVTSASRVSSRRVPAAGAALAAAAAVHAGSRSGQTWCRPNSRWQGHALWHLLSAAAIGVAFGATTPR